MKTKDGLTKDLNEKGREGCRPSFPFKYFEWEKEGKPSLGLRQNKGNPNQSLVENLSTKNRDKTQKSQPQSGCDTDKKSTYSWYQWVRTFGKNEYVLFDSKSTYSYFKRLATSF